MSYLHENDSQWQYGQGDSHLKPKPISEEVTNQHQ